MGQVSSSYQRSSSAGVPMKTKSILVGGKVLGDAKAHVGVVNYELVRVDIPPMEDKLVGYCLQSQ